MLRPTPRNSCMTGTPIFARCSGSPTPESCRMCGEPTAPAEARRGARRPDTPRRQNPLPPGRGPLHGAAGTAAREFDTGRTLAVEQDAMDQRVGDELEVRALQCGAQIGEGP